MVSCGAKDRSIKDQVEGYYGKWKSVKYDHRGYQQQESAEVMNKVDSLVPDIESGKVYLNIVRGKMFLSEDVFRDTCYFRKFRISPFLDSGEAWDAAVKGTPLFFIPERELNAMTRLVPVNENDEYSCESENDFFRFNFFQKRDTLILDFGGYYFFEVDLFYVCGVVHER